MAILKEEKLKVKGWVKKDLVEIKSSKIYFGPIMFRVQNYLEATNFLVQTHSVLICSDISFPCHDL